MILTGILLILTGIICTETKLVHVDLSHNFCTDSDAEDMYGLDGEETFHADFTKEEYVMTLPEFADQFGMEEGAYQQAVGDKAICKQNLATVIQATHNPTVAQAPPMSSIYNRDDVKMGSKNTLICLVTGFYPPPVNVTWTRNNKMVTQGVSSSQLRINLHDGSFNQFYTLQFTPEEGDIYTCTVEHQALDRPMAREFDVEVPAEASLGPAVFCGVGLTLGLLGVATGTFFLVKGNQCN
uniref:MHC class II antigen alpha chain n=1 Tax=Alosa sapidissima TaxID=34773 RepID=A0A8E4SEG9_ALOSP|nr:MHC class II antigen alpha chain [Alosa sapidissima]